MDRLNELKYISTERMYEGIIVEVTDASVTIDLKGRLGQLKIPRRMLISQYDVQMGQEVGFMMSYPEVLDEEPDEKYVYAINESNRRRKEIEAKKQNV
ncbi:CBO2463/CBO2479 domain-containing protein [Bacillus tuaregi]|uniref:CBO2463/CBO2479 domain-containing protein n=1 Tax=Bacillus tuaregi TaxID=1816695 RepID=UPI0008F949AC|nr:CBO2463/CBO2479 domain-containing protein [Bacillus tuaregi]